MRKIHPGFIAIVILLGPATLILAHEKITRAPAQEVFESFDPPPILRQAYMQCAEAPKQQRSAQCDQYVSFFEECAARENECGPQSVYEVLTKLILSAPPKRPKFEKVAIPTDVQPSIQWHSNFTDTSDTTKMSYSREAIAISESLAIPSIPGEMNASKQQRSRRRVASSFQRSAPTRSEQSVEGAYALRLPRMPLPRPVKR